VFSLCLGWSLTYELQGMDFFANSFILVVNDQCMGSENLFRSDGSNNFAEYFSVNLDMMQLSKVVSHLYCVP